MRLLTAAIRIFAISALLLLPSTASVYAASTSNGSGGEACEALSQISPGGGKDCATAGPTPNKLVRTAVNVLTFAAGVIAVIMLIVGGLKFITSDGDAAQAGSARKTIIYAVVGLVVVLFARLIVKFVLDRTT